MSFPANRTRSIIGYIALVVTLSVRARCALAVPEPSFDLDYCAWNATDIVVVEQRDHDVVVRQTWRGSLMAGTALAISDLPAPPLAVAWTDRAGRKVKLDGKRIVLFIKKWPDDDNGPVGFDDEGDKKPPSGKAHWGGTRWNEPTWGSAVWLDEGQAYAIRQMITSILVPMRLTDAGFKKNTDAILAERKTLEDALALADPDKRAATLLPMVRSNDNQMQVVAIQALGKCGAPAVPMLRKLVQENDEFPDLLIEALAAAAGDRAGAEMTALLKRELGFWEIEALLLPQGWREGMVSYDRMRDLDWHHRKLESAMEIIDDKHYIAAEETVTRVWLLWRFTPQLQLKSHQPDPACFHAAETLKRLRQSQ